MDRWSLQHILSFTFLIWFVSSHEVASECHLSVNLAWGDQEPHQLREDLIEQRHPCNLSTLLLIRYQPNALWEDKIFKIRTGLLQQNKPLLPSNIKHKICIQPS